MKEWTQIYISNQIEFNYKKNYTHPGFFNDIYDISDFKPKKTTSPTYSTSANNDFYFLMISFIR